MFILGMVIFLIGITFAILICVSFSSMMGIFSFIDIPSAITYIIVMLSVIIATGSFKVFTSAINAVLSKSYHISAAGKERAIKLFKLLEKTSIYSSIVISLIGIIFMGLNIDIQTQAYQILPSFTIGILPMFYGISVNIILIQPAIYILESRYNAEEKKVISEKEITDKLFELCYKQGITPEEILESKEIHFKN